LPANLIVAGGGGDNAASAVGIGAVKPGQGFVSLGTSGVVFLVSDRFQPAPELAVHAFAHALPGRWHQMSVMLSAASAFGWVTQLTGSPDEAHLSQQVAALPLSRRAVAPVFLPYLSGERTPHNNPNASGVFIGLRSEHTGADLGYSVMEGVSFGLMDGLRAMGQCEPSTQPLTLVGGGARSDAWAQLLANGLGCPLQRPENAHSAAALGAARLAWLADGGKEDEVCLPLPLAQLFTPEDALRQSLAQRYSRYRGLYPALTNFFKGTA
jgi:xylulokinase